MASSPKIHIGFGFRFGNNERFGELNWRNKFTKIKLFHMFIKCYIDCTLHAICHSQFINELHHKFGIKSQLVDFSNISNEFQQLAGDLDFPSKLTWGKLNAWRMLEFWSRCRWILSRFLVKFPLIVPISYIISPRCGYAWENCDEKLNVYIQYTYTLGKVFWW